MADTFLFIGGPLDGLRLATGGGPTYRALDNRVERMADWIVDGDLSITDGARFDTVTYRRIGTSYVLEDRWRPYETYDDLAGYGTLELNHEYAVDGFMMAQEDWPRRRSFIISRIDEEIGEKLVEAIKRGWMTIVWHRHMWSDHDPRFYETMPAWFSYNPTARDGWHIRTQVILRRMGEGS